MSGRGRPISLGSDAGRKMERWRAEPACEKCRCLEVFRPPPPPRGAFAVRCGKGHAKLEAAACPDFDDASKNTIPEAGGLTSKHQRIP